MQDNATRIFLQSKEEFILEATVVCISFGPEWVPQVVDVERRLCDPRVSGSIHGLGIYNVFCSLFIQRQ